MGDFMGKLLLKQDEMILLKNSEAVKNIETYGNMYDCVMPYKVLSEIDLQKNELFNTKARATILGNKNLLFQEIKDEWYAIGCNDETTEEVHCQLCGRKNKRIFYIKNRKNNNELHVGSECIKKFSDIENISVIRKTMREQLSLQNENKRRIQFSEIELDNVDYIKNAEKWFSDFRILLPAVLYNNIKMVLYNLNSLKTNYVKKGGKIEDIREQYIAYKKLFEKYKKEALQFYETNKMKPLICRKNLADWLETEHLNVWKHVLENGGFLDRETLEYCYQTEYVRAHLKQFNMKIRDDNIQIVGMNGPFIRFQLQNEDYRLPVYLLVSTKDFMKNIGCYCLTNKKYSYSKHDLVGAKFEKSNSNFEAICNRMKSAMEKSGLRIEKAIYTDDKYYVRLPQVIRASKWSTQKSITEIGYKRVAENNLYEIFDKLMFATDGDISSTFGKIRNKLDATQKKWISQGEKDNLEEISKSMSVQKQREFVPYA